MTTSVQLCSLPSFLKIIKTVNFSPARDSGRRDFISSSRRQPLPTLATNNGEAKTQPLAVLQGDYVLEKELDGGIHKLLQTIQDLNLFSTIAKNPCLVHGGDGEASAVIGLHDLESARITLEDFCRSYFMFHDMDVNSPQTVFKHLPLFAFIDAYVYKMDNLNELIVSNNMASTNAADVFMTDPFKPLKLELERRGLLSERMIEELRGGEEYWSLERKLCAALTNHSEISVEDVLRATRLKSFDYRVMNLIVYQLRGEKVNELHMEFLSNPEFLEEVSDDLHDYQDDVLENNFNILRFFVRIYGPSAAPAMLTKYIDEAEEKCKELMKNMDPELVVEYQRRCQEVTKEDGLVFGYPLCSWTIPTVIEEEEDDMSKSQKHNLQGNIS